MLMLRCLAIAAVCLFASPVLAQNPPPVEAYGRLPEVSDVAISPNGERLALAVSDEAGRTAIRIVNIATSVEEYAGAAPQGAKLRGVGWADDGRALFYVSTSLRPSAALPWGAAMRGSRQFIEYWRVGVLNLATQQLRYVVLDEDESWAHIGLVNLIAPVEGDPGTGRIVSWGQWRSPRLGVYRIDLDRGVGRPIVFGEPDTVGIVLNERGGIAARVDADEDSNHWQLLVYGGSSTGRVLMEGSADDGIPPDVDGILPDGRVVIADRIDEDDRARVYAVNLTSGELEVLAENDRFDMNSSIEDPWTHHVIGASWTEDFPKQRFFEPQMQEVYDRLQQHFAEGYARIVSWSRDRSRFVVLGEGAGDAGGYFLFDASANTMRAIGQLYPQISGEAALGRRQAITYRARDGQRIPAYLTLPANAEPNNLPLVLLVHGGPHARDTFTFDWWSSFLASRGYAVLQPNYRGSTGYGYNWFNAGRGGWGDGVMQTDVEDGVEALVRAGIVDGRRVCIVGASYGGYAALAGATLTPERYACAVSIAGVSDVLRMLNDTAAETSSDSMSSDWWRLSIGDRRNDREHLRTISPANRAADVRVPILLMHGAHDTVVPPSQSAEMAEQLERAGKPHRYVVMQGDDHWLSRAETRTQMLREIETFLAQNLAPAAQ